MARFIVTAGRLLLGASLAAGLVACGSLLGVEDFTDATDAGADTSTDVGPATSPETGTRDGATDARGDGERPDASPPDGDASIDGGDARLDCAPTTTATCTEDGQGQPIPGLPDPAKGICKLGVKTCQPSGTWGPCVGAIGPRPRDCEAATDNDCDGLPDNTIDAVCECNAAHPTRPFTGGPKNCQCTETCATDHHWTACTPPAACDCSPTDSRPCTGASGCAGGTQTCASDRTWGACAGAPDKATYCIDHDGDTFCAASTACASVCPGALGAEWKTGCATTDCDDNNASINPKSPPACRPTNDCHTGLLSCSASGNTCKDTGTSLPNQTSCGSGGTCNGGTCATCGNGTVETGEVCDDHNTTNGDGCDPTCQFTGTLSVAAGIADGIGRADGIGSAARLFAPAGLATDLISLYFGDDCTVKRFDPSTQRVTTIAGAWGDCSASVDGPAATARFTQVANIEFVPSSGKGVLYISGDNALRKLDLTSMEVSSIAGVAGADNGRRPDGLALGSDGAHLYLIDVGNGLRSVTLSNNSSATLATLTQLGNAVCTDVVPFGADLYLACGNLVLKVTPGSPNPTVTTYAGNQTSGPCVATTGPALTSARLGNVNQIAVDTTGVLTVTDTQCHVVWEIAPGAGGGVIVQAGTLNTAGHADSVSGGAKGTLNGPVGVAMVNGTGYVVDTGNRLIRSFDFFSLKSLAGVYSPHPGGTNVFGATPQLATPLLVMANGNNPLVSTFSFSTTTTMKLDLSSGSGTEFFKSSIYGTVLGGSLYGPSSNGDSTISAYALATGVETHYAGAAHTTTMPSTDGPLATAVLSPGLDATDGTNLYFLDGQQIRMVDVAARQVKTIAGTAGTTDVLDGVGAAAHFAHASAIACDGPNLYVLDGGAKQGSVVRKVALATKAVTTLAGQVDAVGAVDGVGSAARFAGAKQLATDGHALYITDPGDGYGANNGSGAPGDRLGPVIRELELATNRVTTMIGTRGQWTMRPGVGTAAAMSQPYGIAFDAPSHALYVTDFEEDVVYKVK